MRFGACTSIGNLRFLKEMGMDYIELNFSRICEMPESELREIAEQLSTYGMEAETFNGFFPASFLLRISVPFSPRRKSSQPPCT